MDKKRDKPVTTGLMGWVTVLGLSFMSMQAPAFDTGQMENVITGHLEEGTPHGAAHELVQKLGYAESGPCTLVLLEGENSDLAYRELFRVECGEQKLFLKFDDEPVAQAFLLEAPFFKSSPMLSASIVQPLAEFSFRREGRGLDTKEYCSAYPWIPGDTLEDLLNKVRAPEREAEYLTGIYRQLGRVLGEMHSAGLVDADKPLQEMESCFLHSDLHSGNLKITPDNKIVILDIDSFTTPEEPVPVQEAFVENVLGLFVAPKLNSPLFVDSPSAVAWLRVLPDAAEALLTSYCQTLVKEDKVRGCVSQIAEQVTEVVWRKYNRALEESEQQKKTQSVDEQETELAVGKDEMACRLERVFGSLR